MAQKLKVIDRGEFKRGDTAGFMYVFTPPYADFDWSAVTIDCAFTDVEAPANNSAAAAVRTGEELTVDPETNIASYLFQLTEVESKALTADATYKDECQLKQGGTAVATPITGKSNVVQDYVI